MSDVDEAAGEAPDEADAEARRERMRELGKRGGKASGETRRRKSKTLSRSEILEIARRSNSAYGVARLLAELPPEESKAPLLENDRSASFIDVLRDLWKTGALELMLIELGALEPDDPPGGGEGGVAEGGAAEGSAGSPRGARK